MKQFLLEFLDEIPQETAKEWMPERLFLKVGETFFTGVGSL